MPSLKFRRNCKYHLPIWSYPLLSDTRLCFPRHSTTIIFLSFLSCPLFHLFLIFHILDYTADLSHYWLNISLPPSYPLTLPLTLPPFFLLSLSILPPPSLLPSISHSLTPSCPPSLLPYLLPYLLPSLPLSSISTVDNVDREALGDLFNQYDSDKSGTITLDELETMLSHLGVGTYLPSTSTAFLHS